MNRARTASSAVAAREHARGSRAKRTAACLAFLLLTYLLVPLYRTGAGVNLRGTDSLGANLVIDRATFTDDDRLPPTTGGIGSALAAFTMVVGAPLPFVPQAMKIVKARNAAGFSKAVCLVLLVANTLRVCFYLAKPFETPLLLQSVLMIAVQLALLATAVRFTKSGDTDAPAGAAPADARVRASVAERVGAVARALTTRRYWRSFWRWGGRLDPYLAFLALFAAGALELTWLMAFRWRSEVFVELLGFAALLTESGLSAPQLWLNCKRRAVRGLSVLMVAGFLLGDIYKLAYFVLRASPVQFVACACVQIAIDGAICLQICFFPGEGGEGGGGGGGGSGAGGDAASPACAAGGGGGSGAVGGGSARRDRNMPLRDRSGSSASYASSTGGRDEEQLSKAPLLVSRKSSVVGGGGIGAAGKSTAAGDDGQP